MGVSVFGIHAVTTKMARNRFPGKPAKITLPKRQRVISKKFALNKENLVLNENVSRGINCFYSMIGESDEDEDFHGFTEKEIQFANLKSEYLQAQTEQHREAFWAAKGVALDPEDREEIFRNSGASTASLIQYMFNYYQGSLHEIISMKILNLKD